MTTPEPIPTVANPLTIKVRFVKVKLDRSGYEQGDNTRYYGIGLPLYRFFRVDPDDGWELELTELRASDRRNAREKFKAYAKGRQMANVEFLN